jgi:signal peptidase I
MALTRKKVNLIIIAAILCTVLLLVARYLNWIQFYTIPTTNMEPAYQVEDFLIASNIPKIKVNDVVAYRAEAMWYETSHDSYVALCRIVAKAHDTLQIKNGTLYVNGKMVDDTMNLCYNFSVDIKTNFEPSAYDMQNKVFPGITVGDITIVNFSYNELKKYHIFNRCFRNFDTTTVWIDPWKFNSKVSKEKWTNDNFGPVIVPENYYFLLGDNRSNSLDSRQRGFIPEEKIIAKILN